MSQPSLTVTDNRTGKSLEVPVQDGAVRAIDLRQFKTSPDDFGLLSYDPAYLNTASCRSTITFIDGDKGILEYRGFPIDQLAERSTMAECAYLTVHGELPTSAQLTSWEREIASNYNLPAGVLPTIYAFDRASHPCVMMISCLAALSGQYPDARRVLDPAARNLQAMRLIGHVPTLAATIYRHTQGHPPISPDASLPYTANFLRMMFAGPDGKYQPSKALVRAMDVLLILHLDHEQNCSTSTMRGVASSHSDLFCAASAAMAALYGPLHGGANEEVLHMLKQIGHQDKVADFVKSVKEGHGKIMGFGHRVYKNYDPRARVIKQMADAVFAEVGKNPLIDLALELERIALSDEYFISRKLYPNVDFYSGLVYEAFKLPEPMFTVMFAVARASGWAAHYLEIMQDAEQKIARPRQLYLGARGRNYVPIGKR
ncbi:MAG TPA: citrate synthase [Candidatus Saccharimonadales bacterium]|nr:citrate synthase [Candidatus Saccharimonadales bacterium]